MTPLARLAAEATFTVRDGCVFQRGVYRTPEECARLLTVYRRHAAAGDWWSKDARNLANELAAAMEAAGLSQKEAA